MSFLSTTSSPNFATEAEAATRSPNLYALGINILPRTVEEASIESHDSDSQHDQPAPDMTYFEWACIATSVLMWVTAITILAVKTPSPDPAQSLPDTTSSAVPDKSGLASSVKPFFFLLLMMSSLSSGYICLSRLSLFSGNLNKPESRPLLP